MPRAAHSGPTIAKAAKSRAYGASGVRVALSVLGADDSGEAKLTYRWASTGTAPVVFSANDSNAAQSTIATVVAAGEYQFTATITDPSGRSTKSTTTYAVTHKQASIVVNPARTEVAEEGVQRFSATAYDQFNHRLAKQPSFAWSVARTGVGGKVDPVKGIYTAPVSAAGIDRVVASTAKISSHSIVHVVEPAASIVGTQAQAANAYDLAATGSSDWAHWGTGGVFGSFDHSATGASQISDVEVVGSGTVGTSSDPSRFVDWTGGTPLADEPADDNYIYASGAAGSGFSFTVPADQTSRTLMIDAGGYAADAKLTAHLSDGSAADVMLTSSGSGNFTDLYTIKYNAASAGQTLRINFVKTGNVGNQDGSVDLIAAMLSGGSGPQKQGVPLTIMPLGDSITAGVGLSGDDSPSPNYRLPLYDDLNAAGVSIQYEGANNPSNQDAATPGYCPRLFDLGQNFNNGFEGYTSGDILANLAGSQPPEFFPVIHNQGGFWLTGGGGTGRPAQFPDVVTLMVGTNDAIFGVPLGTPTTAGTLEGNVTAILAWFAEYRPATKVLVASAIPNVKASINQEIVSYDAWLATEVPTFANDRFINVYPLFTNSDGGVNTNMLQADGTHPIAAGYADIGAAFATGIESVENGS